MQQGRHRPTLDNRLGNILLHANLPEDATARERSLENHGSLACSVQLSLLVDVCPVSYHAQDHGPRPSPDVRCLGLAGGQEGIDELLEASRTLDG